MSFSEIREAAAERLFESGSVAIDLDEGFKIKAHEKFPEAPRSPIYLSIRPEGVKSGMLTQHDLSLLGKAMFAKTTMEDGFGTDGECWVAGIPAAGEPLVDAMIGHMTAPIKERVKRFRLWKDESPTGRKIAGIASKHFPRPQNVMLVDDLVTNAGTKIEAIDVVEGAGGKVKNLILFLDRSKDAPERIAKRGVKTQSVWTFGELIDFYLARGHVSRTVADRIMGYPEELASHIAAHS